MGTDPASEYPSREELASRFYNNISREAAASIRNMQFGVGEISPAEVTHGFNLTHDIIGILHREIPPEEAALNSHYVLFPKGRRKDNADELPSIVADLEQGTEEAGRYLIFEKMPNGTFLVCINGQSCIIVKNGSTYWAHVGSNRLKLGADIDEARVGISKLLEKMSQRIAL